MTCVKSFLIVTQILQVASMLRKRVRVIGGCYSPSDIACTSEFMVCLKNYSAVLEASKFM